MFDGGYVMIGKTDNNIYEKSKKALTLGKPILFYEDATTSYYIDTITLDGSDNVVLTKGGKTITIANDNTITESGEIQNHLYKYEIEIVGEDENTATHEIRFMLDTDKKIENNKNDILNYFKSLLASYDWPIFGWDFESTNPIVIFSIQNILQYREFMSGDDLTIDLGNEDTSVNAYLLN